MARKTTKPIAAAVAAAATRAGKPPAREPRKGRPSDVFGGELRRRDVFGLLVLHPISDDPGYGKRLIEEIEEMTQGVISVNPNIEIYGDVGPRG